MNRVLMFKVFFWFGRCFAYLSFLIFLSSAQAESAVSDCEDCWSPNPSFDIENGGINQTMAFVSGYGYALNNASKILLSKGKQNYFCNDGEIIGSEEIIGMLNKNLSGQVTAEQVSAVITFELIKKYPCNK